MGFRPGEWWHESKEVGHPFPNACLARSAKPGAGNADRSSYTAVRLPNTNSGAWPIAGKVAVLGGIANGTIQGPPDGSACSPLPTFDGLAGCLGRQRGRGSAKGSALLRLSTKSRHCTLSTPGVSQPIRQFERVPTVGGDHPSRGSIVIFEDPQAAKPPGQQGVRG